MLPQLPVCHQLQNLHHKLPKTFPAHLLLQLNLVTESIKFWEKKMNVFTHTCMCTNPSIHNQPLLPSPQKNKLCCGGYPQKKANGKEKSLKETGINHCTAPMIVYTWISTQHVFTIVLLSFKNNCTFERRFILTNTRPRRPPLYRSGSGWRPLAFPREFGPAGTRLCCLSAPHAFLAHSIPSHSAHTWPAENQRQTAVNGGNLWNTFIHQ